MIHMMKFKNLQDKYKLLLSILAEFILALINVFSTNNDTIYMGTLLLYLIIFLYIFLLLWRMYMKRFFGNLKSLIEKLSKYIVKKARYLFAQAKKILKDHGFGRNLDGLDKKSIEFDFNLYGEIKKLFKSKMRVDLNKTNVNAEKIKMIYIKLILQSIRSGYDYNSSQTPDEINEMLKNQNLEYIINCYKSVRYDCDIDVSNENVFECEDILIKQFSRK